jgi:hypothetical protein
MLQVKNAKHLFDNNVNVLGHIKAYYGCYEAFMKNVNLHIHTLLCLLIM